ncbi:hypothetical protein HPB50_022224 [Hyalomma asiaticum]|uniref:Uncharacterized protein n=1 Tax=Hyalomma asiaticum TaxID=266040 RepID=A0ACB7SBG0_HYAAI|nr:hypothetical protein HPB50_022224 [Hyalomma asiaticum]
MASSGDVVAPVKSVDKLKYLEKYMSGKEKKKKKRVKPSSTQRLRILDDDVDLKHIPSAQSREATPEEDEPVVASVIDDRPLQARVAEQYTPAQWKKIGKEPGELLEKFRERSKQTPHKSRKVTRKNSPSESKHKSEKHRKEERESTKGKEVEKVQEVVKLRDTTKADKAKEKAAKEAEMAAIYSKWGKGLAQQEQQDQNLADHLHEMSKPFSRYEDDEDLEKHLKDQEREGDPMLNYIRKKKKKQAGDGASGRPTYSGPEPPPNRYGIRPGYRWDGVDRSNGFEKKLIESKNNKKAVEEIAYKWSVEDL